MSRWMEERRAESAAAVRRWQATWLGVALLIAAVVVYSQAGCGANTRRATLTAELVALNAARDSYVRWDRDYQMSIVERATSRDEARANVDAYRSTVQVAVMRAFAFAYGQLAAAAVDDKKPIPSLPGSVTKALGELKPGKDPPTGFDPCGSDSACKAVLSVMIMADHSWTFVANWATGKEP